MAQLRTLLMRKVNGIYVTKCISFPRSGHHWLESRLRKYLGGRLNYCEVYAEPEKAIDVCDQTNYQKSHDFELKEKIRDDIKYIIQFRNFEDAAVSYYRLEKLKYATQVEEKDPASNKPYVNIDSDEYLEFIKEIKPYYDNFIAKWVNAEIPNALIIKYEDLLADPINGFKSVISFITDEEVDLNRLRSSVF